LSELSSVRMAIIDAAAELTPVKQDQVFLGTWSMKDLLAHLAGWDDANLEALRALPQGKLPGFYAYRDKDWAGYNALLVRQYRVDDFNAMLDVVKESHQQLLEAARQIPAHDFDRDWQVRYKGYRVIISRLLQAEEQDERVHLEQIRSFSGL
jgi:hypothetical protein